MEIRGFTRRTTGQQPPIKIICLFLLLIGDLKLKPKANLHIVRGINTATRLIFGISTNFLVYGLGNPKLFVRLKILTSERSVITGVLLGMDGLSESFKLFLHTLENTRPLHLTDGGVLMYVIARTMSLLVMAVRRVLLGVKYRFHLLLGPLQQIRTLWIFLFHCKERSTVSVSPLQKKRHFTFCGASKLSPQIQITP